MEGGQGQIERIDFTGKQRKALLYYTGRRAGRSAPWLHHFLCKEVILLFGGIDLISAAWHFMLWDRKGRPDMEDDGDSLLSDWKSGEHSPVKVSLALMAGILALALVIVLQG